MFRYSNSLNGTGFWVVDCICLSIKILTEILFGYACRCHVPIKSRRRLRTSPFPCIPYSDP